MRGQRTTGPWNPSVSIEITPAEYEDQVCSWLIQATEPVDISWVSRKLISGRGGDYEIDVVGEMSLLGGAQFRILVECKRWRRPVDRNVVLAHALKVRNTASHKGMIFSTSGFQRGALEAAAEEGIATVAFVDGNARYETRSLVPWVPHHEPSDWMPSPKYDALLMSIEGNIISTSRVSSEHMGPLTEWIRDDIPQLP